jgi:predicted helicase
MAIFQLMSNRKGIGIWRLVLNKPSNHASKVVKDYIALNRTFMITQDYINQIKAEYETGKATEHSYRPALKSYIESVIPDITATNEPKRQKCGAPDYIISKTRNKNNIDVGYIEAKDIGVSLDKTEKSEQMQRYLESLDNLILTDYIDFRFFKNGVKVHEVKIAEITDKQITPLPQNAEQLETLLKDFALFQGQTIKSAKKLAEMMAGKARLMRDVFYKAVTNDEHNSIQDQYATFKQILIHDMSEEDFADVYAQTITYGLFTARLHDKTLHNFSREESYSLMPKSNPFLRSLFLYVATDLDDGVAWVVDALCEVYLATNLKDILSDFGKTTGRNDPIVHFYETFLSLYDKGARKDRGVWYTPEAVVNFIVRSVDDVLKKYFDLPEGIADTSKVEIEVDDQAFVAKRGKGNKGKTKIAKKKINVHKVQLLDVATGTGTFIAEAIKQIYKRYEGQDGIWSSYVDEHLLPRLHGFEILMASYAMCHMKIDLLLQETGYKTKNESNPPRLSVYLTNSLEEHHPDVDTLFASWLSKEANDASYIKRDIPVMVAFGNPPYNVSSQNKGDWITGLLKDYKKDLNEKKINLDDDYIKFIRYSEHYIEKNGYGVVAMITNNSFIDGVTHRQMRKHLLETFDKIYVYDLHGNSSKQEKAPDGKQDKNVFDIQQGVCIFILIKHKPNNKELAEVWHSEIFNSNKKAKLETLFEQDIQTTPFKKLDYKEPYYFFVPKDFDLLIEYDKGFGVNELMTVNNSGVKTDRDALFIDNDKIKLSNRVSNLLSGDYDNNFTKQYRVEDSGSYKITRVIKDKIFNENKICKIQYRPFDSKYIYYDPNIVSRPAYKVMKHIEKLNNIALVFMRQYAYDVPYYCYTFISSELIECRTFISNKGICNAAPLYLYPTESEQSSMLEDKTGGRKPNLDMKIVNQIAKGLKLKFIPDHEDNNAGADGTFTPLDLLDYIYAILHSPSYREKYKEFLKIDFPRVPYPDNADKFFKLVKLGGDLRALHLMESPELTKLITKFPCNGDNVVGKINAKSYRDGNVYINDEQYFEGVPEIAWNFYIGGYQPAQKWLKDRKDRELSFDDIMHYQKIIKALFETDRIMKEIDGI